MVDIVDSSATRQVEVLEGPPPPPPPSFFITLGLDKATFSIDEPITGGGTVKTATGQPATGTVNVALQTAPPETQVVTIQTDGSYTFRFDTQLQPGGYAIVATYGDVRATALFSVLSAFDVIPILATALIGIGAIALVAGLVEES